MKKLRFASVAMVVAVFLAALVAGWAGDALPATSEQARQLASLSLNGLGITFALGLAVGLFWLFRDESRKRAGTAKSDEDETRRG